MPDRNNKSNKSPAWDYVGDGDADLVDVLLAPFLHLGEGHHVQEEPVHCRRRRLGAGQEQVEDHTPHVSGCTQSTEKQTPNLQRLPSRRRRKSTWGRGGGRVEGGGKVRGEGRGRRRERRGRGRKREGEEWGRRR